MVEVIFPTELAIAELFDILGWYHLNDDKPTPKRIALTPYINEAALCGCFNIEDPDVGCLKEHYLDFVMKYYMHDIFDEYEFIMFYNEVRRLMKSWKRTSS